MIWDVAGYMRRAGMRRPTRSLEEIDDFVTGLEMGPLYFIRRVLNRVRARS